MEKKQRAIIVGGSIAGVSCAHSLTLAGWEVLVLDKSTGPPAGTPTGAGLCLDSQASRIIRSWLPQPDLLDLSTLPISIDQNQAIDSVRKVSEIIKRDENFDVRVAHWSDIYKLLCSSLPSTIFLWGHLFLSLTVSQDKATVKVIAKILETQETVEIQGDLLIAADGSLSSIRKTFLPDHKLRYSGYCAWRGVSDFSSEENSETVAGIRRAYPDMGRCLYIDLGSGTHTVHYELLNKRFNWVWYVTQSEPQLKRNSVTMKGDQEMLKKMHQEADRVWFPEFSRLIKETNEPFFNVIYDSDPLEQIVWDNVVLVGDAAHPTTPHGQRSTNMAVVDAEVLGRCLKISPGTKNLHVALKEYQKIRLPVVSKQVLHSRLLGRIKQGLEVYGDESYDQEILQQKNLPFFPDAPLSSDSLI